MTRLSIPALALLLAAAAATPTPSTAQEAATPAVNSALQAAVADPGRDAAQRARDRYRHPAETLAFFGLTPTDTVIEISPGSGWYSAILA
ncbi:MAG TPA: methyltransferase, partial [Thermomonas sp.]